MFVQEWLKDKNWAAFGVLGQFSGRYFLHIPYGYSPAKFHIKHIKKVQMHKIDPFFKIFISTPPYMLIFNRWNFLIFYYLPGPAHGLVVGEKHVICTVTVTGLFAFKPVSPGAILYCDDSPGTIRTNGKKVE